jgi:DNA-binding MarR family transcriptional regulator
VSDDLADAQVATESSAAGEVDLGPLGQSLGFLLRLAQIRNFAGFYEEFAAQGLKPGEFTVLDLIGRNPGVRQGVLAARLSIKRAHMTKLVRALADAGLVARRVPPEDRRAVELRLTKAGQAHLDRHGPSFHAFGLMQVPELTEGEQAVILGLLRRYLGLEDRKSG